jgi:hypothetical protein
MGVSEPFDSENRWVERLPRAQSDLRKRAPTARITKVKSETSGSSPAVESGDIPRPRAARLTVLSVQELLRVYEPPIRSVPEDRQPVVHVLWGWWKYLVDQAELVVREAQGRRFTTTAPLVRSIGEHADLMLWLADAGPEASQRFTQQTRALSRNCGIRISDPRGIRQKESRDPQTLFQ